MSALNSTLTQDELKTFVIYDHETGIFKWRNKFSRKINVGDVAGYTSTESGYVVIRIKGTAYRAHRLAWLYVYGKWPKDQIDHINRVRNDNRIENLRDVTSYQNSQNTSRMSRNINSGCVGIYHTPQRWRVEIRRQGQVINVGSFYTKEDAILARAKAEAEIQEYK